MKKWVVCLVIGLGMLAFSTGVGINDNTIRCGSEIMGPGDVCEETRAGSVTDTETYEEMKESKEAGQRTFNSWGRWALLGGGLLLTGLGIWGIVKVKRAKKKPYLGPGYTPGQAEPRQPGQPDAPYMQGMTPLPPDPPGPQQGYSQQGYVPQPPNYAPPQQQYPPQPQQQNYPPQQNPQQPQQPFGPGSQ